MRRILYAIGIIFSLSALPQWEISNVPTSSRYDDLFFINEDFGWAVSGGSGHILKTTDGGETWVQKFTAPRLNGNGPRYLRSIEFATETLGFAGSLDGRLFMFEDGGESWMDISSRLPRSIPGVCGLAAPSAEVIYGCGHWISQESPVIIKSIDAGATWTVTDMSTYATQLVELFFLNENEGYAGGRGNPTTDGGVILHTTDGGTNWTPILKTMVDLDYIWKIQTPDSVNYFGSVQSEPFTQNVRFAKSTDGAATWSVLPVQNDKWNYMQMIGFKDALNGWTGGTADSNEGGETTLYETTDGGGSWTLSDKTNSNFNTFNRFFMLDEENFFLTGRKIYRYSPEVFIEPDPLRVDLAKEVSSLIISSNPISNQFIIKTNILNTTLARNIL